MSNALKQQVNLIGIAVAFFTRIPMPRTLDFSQQQLNRASRYFPLVGWLVGLISAGIFLAVNHLVSSNIAILMVMGVGFLLTGGFHEDGLADTADGLGGGWSKSQKLSIMKDSRLGSYGALAIWFALTLKFVLLSELGSATAMALIIAHPLSRFLSTALIRFLPYVTDDASSKVKPLAEKLSVSDLLLAGIFGLSPLILVVEQALVLIVILTMITAGFAMFLKRQIGGFTGDALGATQQITELSVYCLLLVTGALA